MGLRGKGANRRLDAAREAGDDDLAWQADGLSRAERVVAFLESLPITKGILVGQRMRLLPEQRTFVERIYGHLNDGRRITKIAVQSEPKGNGKTGLTAGLCLCHLVGPEAEPRGEVYSAAIDRDQAGIMFEEMEAIILATPWIAKAVNIQRFKKRLEVLEGEGEGSKYESLSSDARGAHGRAPSLWVYDELAQAKDRRLLDNLMQGMSKRDEALGIVLSTQAPDDTHPLSELIDDGLSGKDPSLYVQLIAAPEDADPFDEATLKACNPAWGHFLDVDDLMNQAQRARRIPSMEPGFRNLRCNQRIHATVADQLMSPRVWKDGVASLLVRPGDVCWGGLDLSGKNDLTALVLVFPQGERVGVLPFFWTPEGQLSNRRPAEEDLFRLWIKQEHLFAIPGDVIRYDQVALKLGELAKTYKIQGIAYDRWRMDEMKIELAEAGVRVPLVPWGQGYKDMSPAIDRLHELALSGSLMHGDHPVLNACVANSRLSKDPAGNLKIDKSKLPNGATRIDGAVAMTMALGLMATQKPPQKARGKLIAL